MTYEATAVTLKSNHIYPEPLLSESGEVVGLEVKANPATVKDRVFYIEKILDKKEFKITFDKTTGCKIFITKK